MEKNFEFHYENIKKMMFMNKFNEVKDNEFRIYKFYNRIIFMINRTRHNTLTKLVFLNNKIGCIHHFTNEEIISILRVFYNNESLTDLDKEMIISSYWKGLRTNMQFIKEVFDGVFYRLENTNLVVTNNRTSFGRTAFDIQEASDKLDLQDTESDCIIDIFSIKHPIPNNIIMVFTKCKNSFYDC